MPTEIYREYLHNFLANQKSFYDYLQLILPIVSGIILAIGGWIFGYFVNNSMFKNEIKKEQYYKLKESAIKIVSLFFEFKNYCYCFINKVKYTFDNNEEFIEKFVTDFSYEKLLKLSYIFKLINIEFPTIIINEKKILDTSNNIEKYYFILFSIKENKYSDKFIEANKLITNTLKELTESIDLLENEINIILNNNAKKLNIIR
jgi:uncharacterized protein YneF (UPF0154 family)